MILRSLVLPALIVLSSLSTVRAGASSTVTCGSAIKLKHRDSGYYLNSEQKNLNSGSGQQIVTAVADVGTHDTLWWVRPAHHGVDEAEYPESASCAMAAPIRCNTIIRLTHLSTMRNLHSHGVESPMSRQQEVTAYGAGDGQGDGGDNWRVECRTEHWERSTNVRLYHMDTGKYLGTADNLEFNAKTCGPNCPIMGHLEAFARSSPDKYGDWFVDQGVHLSK